jgi:Na+-driven multidrug efflux pump
VALSGFGIGSDVSGLFTNFTLCMDSSITAMVSINIGAGKPQRSKETAYKAVWFNAALSILLILLCIWLGPYIIHLYTATRKFCPWRCNPTGLSLWAWWDLR